MTFKELRVLSGMNMTAFGQYFGFPYRTMQHWESGTRNCPVYLLSLIEYKLRKEGFIQ